MVSRGSTGLRTMSADSIKTASTSSRHSAIGCRLKAASSKEDIRASVSKEARDRIAEQMVSDFAGFMTMTFEEKLMLLHKYVRKITATQTDGRCDAEF